LDASRHTPAYGAVQYGMRINGGPIGRLAEVGSERSGKPLRPGTLIRFARFGPCDGAAWHGERPIRGAHRLCAHQSSLVCALPAGAWPSPPHARGWGESISIYHPPPVPSSPPTSMTKRSPLSSQQGRAHRAQGRRDQAARCRPSATTLYCARNVHCHTLPPITQRDIAYARYSSLQARCGCAHMTRIMNCE
jgi:hypothetical protein